MNYYDAFGAPLSVGDYAVYGASGYQRLAKVLDIKQLQTTGTYTDHQIFLMTASGNGTFRRDSTQYSTRQGSCNFFVLAKVEDLQNVQDLVDRIEKRLARKK